MKCDKCGFIDPKNRSFEGFILCSVCKAFIPSNHEDLKVYISESVDWRVLDTFRKFSSGNNKLSGMGVVAESGLVVSRPAFGYDLEGGVLVPNADASRVHSLFRTFLNRDYSLSSLAKNFGLSTNGLKKVLKNRTYLGEVKFNGRLYPGKHKPLVSAEVFYAVQRKLGLYNKPRKERLSE